jgi:hypothetical protein
MNWYYVQAGNSVGPVSQTEFDLLVESGVIQPDTLVWQEGMAAWQPYSTVRAVAAPALIAAAAGTAPTVAPSATPTTAGSGEVVCAECGGIFPQDSAIQYGGAWVCANCKPRFVQKLMEGALPESGWRHSQLPADPDELVRVIRQRDYSISIGDCVSRSWDLLKNNFWLLVGGTAISMLIQQGAGFIPFLGMVLPLLLYGVFGGGLYNLFLKALRRDNPTINDVFSGFSSRFLHLTLTTIIQAIIVVAIVAVVGVIAALLIPLFNKNNWNPLVLFSLMPIVLVPLAYLMVSWSLALPLVMDRGLSFWSGMEASRQVVSMHWWKFLGLLIVGTFVMLLGFLAFCIGVFVTTPIFFAMVAYAYDDIFGSGQALKA